MSAQVDNANRIRAVVDPIEAGSDGGGLHPNSDTSHRRPRLDSTPHPPGFLPDEEPSSSQSSSPPSASDDLVLRGRVAPLELIVLLALGGAVLVRRGSLSSGLPIPMQRNASGHRLIRPLFSRPTFASFLLCRRTTILYRPTCPPQSVMATLAPGCVARHLVDRDRRPAPPRRHRSRSLSPSTSARTTFPPLNGSPVWPSGSHRSASLSSTSTWASSIATFSEPPASAIGGGGILRASRSRPNRGNKHVSFSLQNSAALVYEDYSDPLVSDPEEEKEGNLTIEDILEGGTGIAVAPLPLRPSLPAAARQRSVVQPHLTASEEVKGDVGRSRRGISGSPKHKVRHLSPEGRGRHFHRRQAPLHLTEHLSPFPSRSFPR